MFTRYDPFQKCVIRELAPELKEKLHWAEAELARALKDGKRNIEGAELWEEDGEVEIEVAKLKAITDPIHRRLDYFNRQLDYVNGESFLYRDHVGRLSGGTEAPFPYPPAPERLPHGTEIPFFYP